MSDTDVRWRAKKVIQDQSNRLVTDTQIKRWDSKTDPGHTHTKTDITDFPSSMPASDVKAWAKADNKPSYVWNEIGEKPTEFNPSSHKHLKNDITDFPESIKNPLSMSIMLNGGNTEGKDLFTYDGSIAKTVNINYSNIGAAPKEHYHDDRYYTEEETDKLIKGVSTGVFENLTWEKILNKPTVFTPANHTHSKSEINDFPDSLKNPSSITIKLNGGTIEGNNVFTYDGSIAKTIDITAADIGASSIGHLHTVKDIKDFPISMPASDVYDWAKEKFKPSYVWNEIGEKPTEFNPIAHKHVVNEITDFPETMRNPYSISIRLNNGTTEDLDLFTYNGDGEKSINITPIKIDAADRVHTHTRSQITDFPETLRNPAFLTVKFDNMANKSVTSDSYDGSVPKTITVASNIHKHLKEDILDFPDSIKNPKNITLILDNGETTTQDFYDGSEAKTFNVASAKHTHSKIDFTDFPVSIKNPFSVTIVTNDGKTTSSDSYDGSIAKTFNLASAKHVHVKSEITDFPDSIKNPSAITIVTNNGETTSKDTYDGSLSKTFELASAKHVHVKSEITDFPSSIKNPTSLSIQLNGGAATVYDGSSAKSINITPAGIGASANTHLHDDRYYTESEIDTKLSNISTTLTSHNHTELAGVASTQAVPGKSKDGFMTYHYNVNNGLTNNMPSSNNANAILTISRHAGDYTTQLGFSSDDNIYYRNGVGTTSWKRILDSSNYNNYAPSKTGSGASGTWSINISGKANTAGIADSANAVTWGNVSGKPSTFTPSAHTHTKSQITDFPASLKNPTSLSIQLNGGTATVYDGSNAKSINITPAGIGASASGHTHNYAGSSSVGGSANSAVKLDTSTAGSATQPVYFSGGKPVACTYSLNKSVPSNAVFTDTNTWRGIQNNLTSDSTNDSLSAAQGKVLKGLVDGKAAASHTHTKSQITDFPTSMPASDVYSWAKASSKPSYSWSEIGSKPSTFTPSSHTHDFVVGSYTGNGGQQKPNYFGTNKVGFLMMNTTVNGNSQCKDWVIMDCYSGTDVGGGVAIGVNRQSLGAYIMRSDATRTAWAESAELLHTKNYTSYTVTKSGGGASGTWGINISGKASTAGTADSAKSVAWGNVSGKPSTFTPSAHTHTKSEVGLGNVDNTADSAKSVKYATSAGSATTASQLMLGSRATTFNWNGQGGQPEWLFGSNESNITGGSTSNVYVYNPSNFHVAHANESSTLGITANPINSNNLDTPLNFAQHSVSAYFITTNGQVTDQPSTYGMLLNVGWPGSDCHQIWMNQPGDRIYQRGGNSAGWSGSWHRILCDDDIIETAYYYGADDVLLYTPNESAIRFNGGTPWGIAKLPNSLQVVNGTGSKFRFQNSYCYCDAGFYSKGIFNTTSSSTANLHIDSNGLIHRIGSASKYKLDIKPLEEDSSYPYKLLNLQPKQWFDKGETERYAELLSKEYNGEEMDEESRVVAENSNIDSYYGLIAEDLEATGLEKFCSYGKENKDGKKEVEGIMYDRIPILMIPILKDLVEYVKTTYPLIKDSIKDKDAASKVSSIIDRMNSINDSTMVNTTYKVDNTEK